MDKYRTLGFIGEGSFGRVFKGETIDTNEIVALKFIPKRNKVDRELKILKGECDIQQGLFHPNIVRMIDYFETDREVVAVSEYLPVQLFSKLKEHGKMSEYEVRQIACNLVSAIYYLHSLRILHRDIKPQNILLTSDGVAKLCDFGFSRKMGFDTYVLTSIKGTPLYMAPEVIKGRPYDQKVDLWSLGCILFELLTGKPPFNTTSIADLVNMIQTKNVKWPDDFSSLCSSFLKGLLQKDPNQRIGWPTILEHNWIKDRVVLLTTPLDNPLTSPLSSFQQKVRAEQECKLMDKAAAMQSQSMKRVIAHVDATLKGKTINTDDRSNIEYNTQTNIVNFDICKSTAVYCNLDLEQTREHYILDNELLEKCQTKTQNDWQSRYNKNYNFANNHQGSKETDQQDCKKNFVSNNQKEMQQRVKDSLLDNDSDNLMGSDEVINHLQSNFASFFISEEKSIQKEEWARFLDKALVEVLEHNFNVYHETSELSLFLSPLQSKSCPIVVIEKVVDLLRLPFVEIQDATELEAVIKVYYDCKVLPNLMYSYAHSIHLHKDSFSEENLDMISKIINLLCYLCHSDKSFVFQLCDIICILSIHEKLGVLIGSSIDIDAKAKFIAILTQVLRTAPEKSHIVNNIVNNCNKIYYSLAPFISSRNTHNKKCLCSFIAYCIMYSCLVEPYPNGFLHDIANMKNDIDADVRESAHFAIKTIEMFTNVFANICFV